MMSSAKEASQLPARNIINEEKGSAVRLPTGEGLIGAMERAHCKINSLHALSPLILDSHKTNIIIPDLHKRLLKQEQTMTAKTDS